MSIVLRDYQARAVNEVMRLWRDREATNVCLTAPTGSGKTVMLEEIVHRARRATARVLWVCHRDSLVRQARAELERRHLGEVGCVHPDYPMEPERPIQAATVQSMLAREFWPTIQLLLLDEVHHYMASEWRAVADHYQGVHMVGATATPERSDGRPLGDICERMVVAANYSELIKAGHIVDCRLINPPRTLVGGIAQDPVATYKRWAPDKSGFVFCGSVEQAHELADKFSAEGVPTRCIVSETDTEEREQSLAALNSGQVKLLTNVYCCTEGIDVPRAKACILARGCGSVLTYLQMVGRVLRPWGGETHAVLIDLHGSSLSHGFPTEDRVFNLEGTTAIERKDKTDALRQCLRCGFVWRSSQGPACPECGWVAPSKRKEPRIYDVELREVYKGDETPAPAIERELVRLKAMAGVRGFSTGWVIREFRQLFKNTTVPRDLFTPAERRSYYDNLRRVAQERGYNLKWATGCFYKTFGCWP